MSWSASEWSCTSAAANDRVWHVGPARTVLGRSVNAEVGFDARFVVVGAHVLFHLELDSVAAWCEIGRPERTLDTERTARQSFGPVAVDVHIAGEEWSVVAPNADDEHRLDQVAQRLPFNSYRKRLIAWQAVGWLPAAVEDFDALGADIRVTLLITCIVDRVQIRPEHV